MSTGQSHIRSNPHFPFLANTYMHGTCNNSPSTLQTCQLYIHNQNHHHSTPPPTSSIRHTAAGKTHCDGAPPKRTSLPRPTTRKPRSSPIPPEAEAKGDGRMAVSTDGNTCPGPLPPCTPAGTSGAARKATACCCACASAPCAAHRRSRGQDEGEATCEAVARGPCALSLWSSSPAPSCSCSSGAMVLPVVATMGAAAVT